MKSEEAHSPPSDCRVAAFFGVGWYRSRGIGRRIQIGGGSGLKEIGSGFLVPSVPGIDPTPDLYTDIYLPSHHPPPRRRRVGR